VFVIAIGATIVLPFIWMFLSAFKPPAEIQRIIPTFLPEKPTLRAFQELFIFFPFATFLRNSLIVASAVSVFALFSSSLMGYCFAKFRFVAKEALFIVIVVMMILPFEILLVPLYILIVNFKLSNTMFGLILPFIVEPFGIFLCAQFIAGTPSAILDAARIDGLSEWGIYFRIIVPTAKAVLAVLCIFIFLFQWGFVLWPLVVANSDSVKTVALGITLLQTQRGFIYHQTMAAASITIVPALIVFFIMRKGILRGLVLSGMKM